MQERIMSPRILHFCDPGIAWECKERNDAEGYAKGIEIKAIRQNEFVPKTTIKTSVVREDCNSDSEKVQEQANAEYWKESSTSRAFGSWKQIVEVYSKAGLTMPRDKLIALSGIARQMSGGLGREYVVGMWRKRLERQLLWQVNTRTSSSRSPASRATSNMPSFTWASLHTPLGIIYRDASNGSVGWNQDVDDSDSWNQYFEVEECEIHLVDEQNPFGLVEHGRLWLRVRYIREIDFVGVSRKSAGWFFLDSQQTTKNQVAYAQLDVGFDKEILGPRPKFKTYCIPAVWDGTKRGLGHMTCFLLKRVGETSTGHTEF
ncbi:hypothetical protein BDV96DRAFT_45216 [Lophiotrema nucula]|uniref:Heterokaryon incompatibility domain-containing protein n=1 Tax=Lophiotrema nucula TaxID=690887 RepID=A0A6A5ZAG3_9PLEO|nr:hypothetical protein BDV96DRAFT_45216 [Lophiotrema nucula]